MATYLDPDYTEYDKDGDGSDTDESLASGSTDNSKCDSEKDILNFQLYRVKRFRRPIYFTREEVQKAAKTCLRNYPEISCKILDMGTMQQLHDNIINVAVIYAYRFQATCPDNTFTIPQKAAACIFLASKTEDSVRRLDSVISSFCRLENHGDSKGLDSRKMSELIKLIETMILTAEGFQVNMRHPLSYLVQYDQKMELSPKVLTTAHFITTAMIHLTLLALEYPMNQIGAAALKVAAEWCDMEIDSRYTPLWYQTIESNRYLKATTLEAMLAEFKSKWYQMPKLRNRLIDLKKKKYETSHGHKTSGDSSYDSNKARYDRRRNEMEHKMKANWPGGNPVDRRDSKGAPYGHAPVDRYNSWSIPRKPVDRLPNTSTSMRQRPNPNSPNRHSSEERHQNHSHSRYPPHLQDRYDRLQHISPSKPRANDSSHHQPTSANSFPPNKRSHDSHDEHHPSPVKNRKL